MSAAARAIVTLGPTETQEVTLLELVSAITDVAEDDSEVVATVLHLLQAGRVRLRGNFRGTPVEDFA